MLKLPTVILHHQTVHGSHYDWLWLDPVSRDQLLGIRIPHPPDQWQAHSSFNAQPLAPHRIAYLTYQGKVSNGRGSVLQVARGYVQGNRIGKVGWDWQVQLTGSHAPQIQPSVRILATNKTLMRCTINSAYMF
ncbi:MAG: hypothetical protein CMJ19_00320 [Phycisphaeraceae bacterium]|nr:hypothetical protein [Phycisphaeraceae bacterium]